METTRVGLALREGVLEAIRNEGQMRRREEAHGDWDMEIGQREEGFLVTGEEGHPEREEIGWDEWMLRGRGPGERERTRTARGRNTEERKRRRTDHEAQEVCSLWSQKVRAAPKHLRFLLV